MRGLQYLEAWGRIANMSNCRGYLVYSFRRNRDLLALPGSPTAPAYHLLG